MRLTAAARRGEATRATHADRRCHVVVSGALVAGAAWGIYGKLSDTLEGLLVAVAGGALLISAVLDLIEPSTKVTSIWWVTAGVLAGAVSFTALDWLVANKWGSDNGGGLLAAITLDGIPESLALGVALIGARPVEVAPCPGRSCCPTFPRPQEGPGRWPTRPFHASVFVLWAATAVLLSAAALASNLLLEGASADLLAVVRCFAAGAVVASLATEVFPKAFKEDSYFAGVATAIGLIVARLLGQLK